ncbi:hypothetical protein [Azospirillum thermophilum]|nr:hypothetical protein [Azospirillum thermophilum]
MPLILLIFVHFLEHREDQLAQARDRVISLAERGAADHAATILHVHSTLRMLALVPDVRWAMPRSCKDILYQAKDLNPWAVGFAVADTKGTLLCSTVDGAPDATVGEHDFFRRTLREKTFVTGGYWHRGEGKGRRWRPGFPS